MLENEETLPHDCSSFSDSGKHVSNSCEYVSCYRITEAKVGVKKIECRSPGKLILGHLNINSVRNKFDSLKNTISRNKDILLISETKLDDSFPSP